jgi:MFS family permease
MFSGFSLVTLSGYAATTWTPALFIRVYGWTPRQIGFWYGAIYLTCGMSGALFAGWVCDRLTARGWLDAPLKVAALGFLGFGLFGGLAPLMPDSRLALMLSAPAVFLSTMPYPMAATALQLVTPNRMRAQVTALYLTVVNLIGLGVGPLLVGLFTEHLFSRPSDVRYSLAIVNVFCAPVATLLLLVAARPYRVLRRAGDQSRPER